jgi:stage III sporulation protein AH
MIAENLIKNKGFRDVIIFVNDSSVSVILDSEKLGEAEIAQIQNIIVRELNVKIENIHVSKK